MRRLIRPAKRIRGEIEVPGDKSITHRALILGSLCEGKVEVKNFSPALDCRSTLNCLRQLGVEIEMENSAALIKGKGLFGWKKPAKILDAGNSGTTARLLCGVLAGQRFDSALDGDNSLRKRPMERVVRPLSQMGAKITGRENNCFLPMEISGANLKGREHELKLPSAQVKSAILLAGLLAEGTTKLTGALDSRDHTERMLLYLGAKFQREENCLTVQGRNDLKSRELRVPGDFSSAAFFMVAALLIPDSGLVIKKVGLNPTRTGLLTVLERMGAKLLATEVKEICNEPVGNLQIRSSQLQATEIYPEEIPGLIDEIPVLAVAATQAKGVTLIRGASELRVKESDRLAALATELRKMGAQIRELPDGLEITGPTKLKGTEVNSWGDHRIAMALAIGGLIASGETCLEESQWVDISFPNFFERLGQVTR